jgi:hypothetical protein
LLTLSLRAIGLYDEKNAALLFEGVKAYLSKVKKTDPPSSIMLEEILNTLILKMRLPNSLFDTKD